MNYPLVSIIIVNWNGGKVFRDCLTSLYKIDYPNWELIVVDNGSTDSSLEYLQDEKSKLLKMVQNKVNVGFAKANNQGVDIAGGKYILLLNNDTKVTPHFLRYLVGKMENDHYIGAAQPKIRIMDNPKLLDNSGAFLTKTGFLEHWGYLASDGVEFKSEREVFSVKGACMLVRKSLVDKIGLFDEEFVTYMEETDFCWKVWLSGYKVMFMPGESVYHKVGFSSKRQSQIDVNFNSFKNRITSLIKNLEIQNLISIGGTHLFLIVCLSFYYIFRLQFSKFVMIIKAILWNIIHLGRILKKREGVQRFRKISDSELFIKIMHPIKINEMLAHFRKVEENFK